MTSPASDRIDMTSASPPLVVKGKNQSSAGNDEDSLRAVLKGLLNLVRGKGFCDPCGGLSSGKRGKNLFASAVEDRSDSSSTMDIVSDEGGEEPPTDAWPHSVAQVVDEAASMQVIEVDASPVAVTMQDPTAETSQKGDYFGLAAVVLPILIVGFAGTVHSGGIVEGLRSVVL